MDLVKWKNLVFLNTALVKSIKMAKPILLILLYTKENFGLRSKDEYEISDQNLCIDVFIFTLARVKQLTTWYLLCYNTQFLVYSKNKMIGFVVLIF